MQGTSPIAIRRNAFRAGLLSMVLAIAACLLSTRATAANEVRLIPQQSWTNVFGGRDVELRYRVDAKEAFQGHLGWSLGADQRTLERDEIPVTISKGESADISVKLHVPEVRESAVLPALLTVRLYASQGGDVARHEGQLWVFSANPFAGRTEWFKHRRLTLFDPSGETAQCLKSVGVPLEHQKRLAAVENLRDGLLLIGEGISFAKNRGLERTIVDTARRGVPVIILVPSEGKLSLPGTVSDEPSPQEMILRHEEAILRRDKRLDAQGWPPDGQSVASSFAVQSENRRVVAAVEAGQKGWQWLEADYPKPGARLILCGFAIVAHWDATPAPRWLLMRLLEYGANVQEPVQRTNTRQGESP